MDLKNDKRPTAGLNWLFSLIFFGAAGNWREFWFQATRLIDAVSQE